MEGKHVFVILRCQEGIRPPHEDQVVAYLQKKTSELDSAASLLLPDDARSDRSALEQLILHLPRKIRNDIISCDNDCIGFLRKNTPALPLILGEPLKYMDVRYGVLPTEVIEASSEHIKGPEWYHRVFSEERLQEAGVGERFTMRFDVTNGSLPQRAEMDILLRHGVRRSRTFTIDHSLYNPGRLSELLDALYQSFPSSESILELEDLSDLKLEEAAVRPVVALHEQVQNMISKAKAAQEMMRRRVDGRGGGTISLL